MYFNELGVRDYEGTVHNHVVIIMIMYFAFSSFYLYITTLICITYRTVEVNFTLIRLCEHEILKTHNMFDCWYSGHMMNIEGLS